MIPRVLLAHSMFWPNVARLAIAFRGAGFAVDAVAPKGHPIHRMQSPNRTFEYRPTSTYKSIKDSIATSQPDLVVPCDDRIVAHLHGIYREAASACDSVENRSIKSLIESSLGPPDSYDLVRRRSFLTSLGQLPHVHVPQTAAIDSLRDLLDWVHQRGLPAVLKLDGSSGGSDVLLIRNMGEVVPGFLRMGLRKSWLRRMKWLLYDGDIEPFFTAKNFSTAQVSVQSYVKGRLANCAVACWRGNVVGWASVEVLQCGRAFGVASVVRRVRGEPMIAAARSIARHLELSGVFGFDFVLDEDSQKPKLIEINPRATQINHFPGYDGPDLPAALFSAIRNVPLQNFSVRRSPDEVALFPQEWKRDPGSKWLARAFHDVPFEEPELLRFFGYRSSERSPYHSHWTESERKPRPAGDLGH